MNQFKCRVDDRIGALPLPKFDVERAVHVLYVLAMTHHAEIAVLAFYNNGFHSAIIPQARRTIRRNVP